MRNTSTWAAIALIAALCLLLVVNVTGQGGPPRGDDPNRQSEQLTADQIAQVKTILSDYDARSLTADQAKAIHETFRQAGLRGGPALNDAVRAAGFDPDRLRDLAPPPGQNGGEEGRPPRPEGDRPQDRRPDFQASRPGGGPQQYSVEQAISDEAQLHTIAFSGLAFITGDFGAATFIPPGKVCDYFGFQYMRDIDTAQTGHNPMFLDRVAGNVFYVLNDQQRALFVSLAKEQAPQFEQLAVMRYPLIEAFYRQLNGEIPSGSKGLNQDSVRQYVGDIFAFDAQLSYRRAQVFSQIVNSLTTQQKTYLAKMKFGDFNTWPAVDVEAYKLPRGTDKLLNVCYMTYASEFFSWYAGSMDADTYFCPERHGTYFGGFFMKDMPAMGKRDYNISTSLTGDSGKDFLNSLSPEQRQNVTAIPDLQRKSLQETIAVRKAISAELRKYLSGGQADKAKVLDLGRRYGELDGEMSDLYAVAFAKVNQTLTTAQRQTLLKLRNLDGYTSPAAFIYSTPVQGQVSVPNTDHFFYAPKKKVESSIRVPVTVTSPTPGPERNREEREQTREPESKPTPGFSLRSPAVGANGMLPVEFTGDGAGVSPPLEWSGAPAGTKAYALTMSHIDPEGKTKWYWTLYNIPPSAKSLTKGAKGNGILCNNSVNGQVGYAPPHSKGPGAKTYTLTIYALSKPLRISQQPAEVSLRVLLDAAKGSILGSAKMDVVYTRQNSASN